MVLRLASFALAVLAAVLPVTARCANDPGGATAPDAGDRSGLPGGMRPLAGVLFTKGYGPAFHVTDPAGGDHSIDLGSLYDVYAGLEFPLTPGGLALQLTAGLHETRGAGGETARRFPLEAIVMVPLADGLRLGAGVRYPMRLRFSGPVSAPAGALGLNATPSVLATAEIRMAPHVYANLRFVEERYETSDGGSLGANHFDAGVSVRY